MIFYLIDRGVVSQIAGKAFEIAPSDDLFWVEAPENIAVIGDKYIDGKFEPQYNLQERQQQQVERLENIFTIQMGSGLIVDKNTFFSDADSRNLISQALACEDRKIPVFPTMWFMANGAAEVTYDEIKNVSALLVDKVKGCYYNREALRQQIMGSPTPEAVDLTVGWPS